MHVLKFCKFHKYKWFVELSEKKCAPAFMLLHSNDCLLFGKGA
jgi:hypothetical protein